MSLDETFKKEKRNEPIDEFEDAEAVETQSKEEFEEMTRPRKTAKGKLLEKRRRQKIVTTKPRMPPIKQDVDKQEEPEESETCDCQKKLVPAILQLETTQITYGVFNKESSQFSQNLHDIDIKTRSQHLCQVCRKPIY